MEKSLREISECTVKFIYDGIQGSGVLLRKYEGNQVILISAAHCMGNLNVEGFCSDKLTIQQQIDGFLKKVKFNDCRVRVFDNISDLVILELSLEITIPIIRIANPKTRTEIMIQGFPNTLKEENENRASIQGKVTEYISDSKFTVSISEPLETLSSEAKDNTEGFSGSGVWLIDSNNVFLCGIICELKNKAGIFNQMHAASASVINAYLRKQENVAGCHIANVDYVQRKIHVHSNKNEAVERKILSIYEAFLECKGKVLLRSHAGVGKTCELRYLEKCLELNDKIVCLKSLRDYSGGKISGFIPKYVSLLDEKNIVLLFDGFDEIDEQKQSEFLKEVRQFLSDKSIGIVVSVRSNYLKGEDGTTSSRFGNLIICDLCLLDNDDIENYSKKKGLNLDDFSHEIRLKGVENLCQIPFYLNEIIKIWINEQRLPYKNKLMEKMIELQFNHDLGRQDDSLLDECALEYRNTLKMIAFSMLLLHKSELSEVDEFQELIDKDKRKLIKPGGLLQKERSKWQFSHNLFKEYLAAKYLSSMEIDKIKGFIADENGVILPSWINVVGFLVEIGQKNVVEWIKRKNVDFCVVFNNYDMSERDRCVIVKEIFEHFEDLQLPISSDVFELRQFADFACNKRCIRYLIDKIKDQKNDSSIGLVLSVFESFSELKVYSDDIRECMMCIITQCNLPNYYVRRAIGILSRYKLGNELITRKLMFLFEDSHDDYIRSGLYTYLRIHNVQNQYVDYLLNGITLLHESCHGSISRLGDEAFNLRKALLNLSTKNSVESAIKWICRNRKESFYRLDEVLETLCHKATEIYKNGNTEILDTMIESYTTDTIRKREYNKSVASFFTETGTMENAVARFVKSLKQYHYFGYLYDVDKKISEYLLNAYERGDFSDTAIFHDFVSQYIMEKDKYEKCRTSILNKEGIALDDYETRKQRFPRNDNDVIQSYINILFHKQRIKLMFDRILESISQKSIRIAELKQKSWEEFLGKEEGHFIDDVCVFFDDNETLNLDALWLDIEGKLDEILVYAISKCIENGINLELTNQQREYLQIIIDDWIAKGFICNENGNSYYSILIACLISAYSFNLPKEVVSNFLVLGDYYYGRQGGDRDKYEILETVFGEDLLCKCIRENLGNENLDDVLLDEYIRYCRNKTLNYAIPQAIKICKDLNYDEYYSCNALEYLLDYLDDGDIIEMIPYMREELLIKLYLKGANEYKAIVIDRLRECFKKNPSDMVCSILIRENDTEAVEYYVSETRSRKRPYGDGSDGATKSLVELKNVEHLANLSQLVEILFSEEFVDSSFYTLYSCLGNAFVSIGYDYPQEAIDCLKNCIANTNSSRITFCNYYISIIERNLRIKKDIRYEIDKVKQIIKQCEE